MFQGKEMHQLMKDKKITKNHIYLAPKELFYINLEKRIHLIYELNILGTRQLYKTRGSQHMGNYLTNNTQLFNKH